MDRLKVIYQILNDPADQPRRGSPLLRYYDSEDDWETEELRVLFDLAVQNDAETLVQFWHTLSSRLKQALVLRMTPDKFFEFCDAVAKAMRHNAAVLRSLSARDGAQ
jgi:Ser/Thr protein kinase RdoA (MazF antagonist)